MNDNYYRILHGYITGNYSNNNLVMIRFFRAKWLAGVIYGTDAVYR